MLKAAIEVARANPIIGLPKMGAIIAKRRKIIAVGLNSRKTDPLQLRYAKHPLAICKHAEIDAIKNAIKANRSSDLSGSTIFVARILRDGSEALAEPCEGCKRALRSYGILSVRFTRNSN